MKADKVKHIFDVRSELSIRELRLKRTTQPVRCLKCKQWVKDPDSSCSFVQEGVIDGNGK
jgi:hypothetical protein